MSTCSVMGARFSIRVIDPAICRTSSSLLVIEAGELVISGERVLGEKMLHLGSDLCRHRHRLGVSRQLYIPDPRQIVQDLDFHAASSAGADSKSTTARRRASTAGWSHRKDIDAPA